MSRAESYGLLSVLFVVLLEGAVAYVIDRKIGTSIYKFWYDMTHKDPLPAEAARGFIYERHANTRFSVATAIALVQSAIAFHTGALSPVWGVIYTVLQIPVIMAGFYAGPLLNKVWDRRKPILDVVDRIESGETTLGGEVQHVAERVRGSIASASTPEPVRRVLRAVGAEQEPESPPADKPAAKAPEPDPRQAIDDFTRRR